MVDLFKILIFLNFITIFSICNASEHDMAMTFPSDNEVTIYKSVYDISNGYLGATNYSPIVDSKFTGIKITSPENISINKNIEQYGELRIPISMTYAFNFDFINSLHGTETDNMFVIVVDSQTGKSYSSGLQVDDSVQIEPEEPYEQSKEVTSAIAYGYFTFNLANFIDLPETTAMYHVHIQLKNIQSNVIAISVKR